ncbi:aminotransferase class I/II-fold pyridoxal phosphate-dependent enzyme [Maribrevibacterium harenarium]|uniref:Aminotransferase n=1 Tax=Maribrevibacterium harenarium TaxID=2589817 RepID=A0A501WJA6_9GAMM|nr:aminotransferase class I/II-fold pyridoxal phosphate-dependent enzyme [Maribrevibacterium harenarium]TPE48214.1 aminotransferase class I/II-fold pyridoxal phosphate-dependent enzyme [Maribrevibacterium harenarium]
MASGNLRFHLTPLPHGGDLGSLLRHKGGDKAQWLDLSSACNRVPWCPPASFIEPWSGLPDLTPLKLAATAYYGAEPAVIGAGTQQLIEALPPLWRVQYGLGVVMIPAIGYREHGFAWDKWGFTIRTYENVAELLDQDWQVAVVIHPNNPTGDVVSFALQQELMECLTAHPDRLLVWDEAFIDVTPEQSLLNKDHFATLPDNLAVLRSVGKFYGLEGFRVGFLFGLPKQRAFLQSQMGPWPIASISVARVSGALLDREWQQTTRERLVEQMLAFKERVIPKFCSVFDSVEYQLTPFFCTWFLDDALQAEQVFQSLHQVKVHTRLGEGWIRVAMPTFSELETLNSRLTSLISGRYGKELA